MSSDGNTCILGAPLDKDTVGSIDIFIRTGTAWSRQANLVGSGWIGQPQQGSTTAISYDGNTAAWAAATDSFGKSAVWVFKRTGTAWSQDGNKIHGVFTSNVWYPGLSQMGLALSGDGLTLAAGDYGGAHIYLKQSTWVHHQFLNSPNFGTWGPSSQGQFIALSYTGNTIAFTSPRDDYQYQLNTGRAYIFSRPAFTSNYTEKFNTTVSPDHKGTKNIQPITISAGGGIALFGVPWSYADQGCATEILGQGASWHLIRKTILHTYTPGASGQGRSISISTDGKTFITSGSVDNTNGGFWTFKKNGSTWQPYGGISKKYGSDYAGFGSKLALSADGSHVLVSCLSSTSGFFIGPTNVYQFRDSGGSFKQYGDSIDTYLYSYLGAAYFGGSVALSRDGNTALISMVNDTAYRGTVRAYSKTGDSWTPMSSWLTASNGKYQGMSMALSAHGDVAVIGCRDSFHYIYRHTGNLWQLEYTMKSTQGNYTSNVFVSDDGRTVCLGDIADSSGRVTIYAYNGATWHKQAKLKPNDLSYRIAYFGSSVSLSADGNVLAVGASNESGVGYPTGLGAFWTYHRHDSIWTQDGPKLTPSDTSWYAGVGTAIAMTPDANTIIVSGVGDNCYIGATWVYDNAGLRIITDSITPNYCNSNTDGLISVHGAGGTGPYHYRWSLAGAGDTSTLTHLTPGLYYLTVTDAAHDSVTGLFDITLNTSMHTAITHASHCDAANNTSGSLTVHVSGGVAPYTYRWNTTPSQRDSTAVSLTSGSYQFTVTDNSGCQISGPATLPRLLFWSSGYATPANCQAYDGTAVIHPYGTAPYSYQWSNSTTTNPATNLYAGTYTVTVTDSLSCHTSARLNVDSMCVNTISGFLFIDSNGNCIKDPGEPGISNKLLLAGSSHSYHYTTSAADGSYHIIIPDTGAYTVVSYDDSSSFDCLHIHPCSSPAVTFTTIGRDTIISYASPPPTTYDLTVGCCHLMIIPGMNTTYQPHPINLDNYPFTDTATVIFTYDPRLIYQNVFNRGGVPGFTVADTVRHTITWRVSPVLPFDPLNQVFLSYNFGVSATVHFGDTMRSSLDIYPKTGDCDSFNNSRQYEEIVMVSNDPNSKTCLPDSVIEASDSILTYTIHFQNNGNDTARFVTIKDTLSPYVDPVTVRTLMTSHLPYTFDLSQFGILKWTFDPIALPDSATDPIGSQGYITYQVKIKKNLPPGTIISNQAFIFFDYNDPVATNTDYNMIAYPLSITESRAKGQIAVTAIPNPFSDYVTFRVSGFAGKYDFELIDITGKLISRVSDLSSGTLKYDRGSLAPGVYLYKITDRSHNESIGKLVVE
jgi:uncharacterized repeat protein (TIGR01451 family)